ncbi:MAG: hypothetical protein L0H73_16910, partial [Nitrococcus sp.]|nr:hypothetical protein [Nitrococcus sp.]
MMARCTWRGSSDGPIWTGGSEVLAENHCERVLLLTCSGGNRELLLAHLRRRYEVLEPDEPVLSLVKFDLAVVEARSFWQWRHHLMEAKRREEPAFLPVLLILPQRNSRYRLKDFPDYARVTAIVSAFWYNI